MLFGDCLGCSGCRFGRWRWGHGRYTRLDTRVDYGLGYATTSDIGSATKDKDASVNKVCLDITVGHNVVTNGETDDKGKDAASKRGNKQADTTYTHTWLVIDW